MSPISRHRLELGTAVVLLGLSGLVAGQTWCGKHYSPDLPPTPPGGNFVFPPTSATPLLSLRCAPVLRPYLPDDASPKASGDVAIFIDTPVVYSHIANAAPISLDSDNGYLAVSVSTGGVQLASGRVPLNATKFELPFQLSKIQPRAEAYELSCSATYHPTKVPVQPKPQKFTAKGSLSYLPDPPPGTSATKMDLRTGALLSRPADGSPGPYVPVLPVGFYTDFGNYLAKDPGIPAKLRSQGFNIIHPVPTFDNLTALEIALDKSEEAGLYLMYDMRWSYKNTTQLTTEVLSIKQRENLLLWYTADEPDGTSEALDATVNSQRLIHDLDGGKGDGVGYHPVSLVLNCQDYYWTDYTAGADIVMQDAYTVGINATWSIPWGTPCTPDYGDCGCDNCKGSFLDISTRIDEFKERLFINGWDRTKAIWTVPQGFGEQTYWSRYPTGQEFVVSSVLAINHGAVGVVSWIDPTTESIKSAASQLAFAAPELAKYILNPRATFSSYPASDSGTGRKVDTGVWRVGSGSAHGLGARGKALVLATNPTPNGHTVRFSDLKLPSVAHHRPIRVLFETGARVDLKAGGVVLEGLGTGAFVIEL